MGLCALHGVCITRQFWECSTRMRARANTNTNRRRNGVTTLGSSEIKIQEFKNGDGCLGIGEFQIQYKGGQIKGRPNADASNRRVAWACHLRWKDPGCLHWKTIID